MNPYMAQIAAALSTTVVLATSMIQPAAAIHGIVGCENEAMAPLYLLLHQVSLLLFGIGGILAAFSLAGVGIAMMVGSVDVKRRAIERAQRVFLGVIILWVSPFVIAFLLLPINPCQGGV